MTSWVADVHSFSGAELRVLARSEPDRIHVDWDDAGLPIEDLPRACAALRRFLDRASQLQAAAGPQTLPARHPHAGELELPGHPDEHRFFEVLIERLSTHSVWSEPSARERQSGAAVEPARAADGGEYIAKSCRFGPHRGQVGVAEGPPVSLTTLVGAMAAETDSHS